MITETTWIELPDGRRLAARLWLPDDARKRPAPAILEYLPYRQSDGTAERDASNYEVFAEAGYAGVRVDIAGNGDSDGYMSDEYLEDELASGEEVIEWIAAQPWCSGAVGMIGISWGGFNGLQIAMRRPPALRAIVTVCSTDDRYRRETHYIGGCVLIDNFTWGAQMTAFTCRPPDPIVRDDWREVWIDRMQRLPFLAANWLRHQQHGAYWKHGSVCEDWDAIGCAVLAVGGWADSYSDTPPVLVEHLSAPTKAIVGPWEHRYPHLAKVGPRGDFHGEVIRWFDRWLKGKQNGAESLPAYRAYIQEHDEPSPKLKERLGRWIAETSWPPDAPPLTLYLKPGALAVEPDIASQQVTLRSPQNTGAAAGNYCPGMRVDDELPDDQRRDDEKSICFDGDPLSESLEILGAPEVDIEFSADSPRAQLAFRLCDVAPDGASDRVSFIVCNLTHHTSHQRAVDLMPGRRYRLRIPLRHCGHRFSAGHRVRLAASTAYWPTVWPAQSMASVNLHLENCRLILPQRRAQ
ncbi:MAG: CocE/NonD family hydrolase, partial [bacterium]